MRIETTAANLKAALKCVAPVVERRVRTPILSAVKVGKGRIVATNLDMEATVTLPTIGKGSGEAAIDCRSLASLAHHIPGDDSVNLSEDDGLAVIGFNGNEYRIPSYPASEFPAFKTFNGDVTQTDNAGLIEAIRRVRFAISTEETRYYLNGVCFLHKDEASYVAATDGHRLALASIPFIPVGAERAILPRCAVDYLTRRKAEPKSVVFDRKGVAARFDYDGLTLKAKLIDGTYPDVFRVIPTDVVDYFTADRQALLAVLRRIAAVQTWVASWRGVKFTGSADGLALTVDKCEVKVRETLPITFTAAAPFEAGYNPSYLIEVLSALRGETVTFAARKDEIGSCPARITSEGDDLTVILMPMRV